MSRVVGDLLRRLIIWLGHMLLRLLMWGAVMVAGWWSLGALLAFPAGTPIVADAVIVLGGGELNRYFTGRNLVLQGFSSRLMLIEPETPMLRDVAQRLNGVRVEVNSDCKSTWDEAVQMRRWMAVEGIKRVLVVSDAPHLLRVAYAWHSVFRSDDVEYVFIAAPSTWWSSWRWWENDKALHFVASELLKLVFYVGNYRFGLF